MPVGAEQGACALVLNLDVAQGQWHLILRVIKYTP